MQAERPTPDQVLDAAGLKPDASAGGDWPLFAVEAAVRRLRELLAGADTLTRELCRDGAVRRLRGVTSSPARIVDAAFRDETSPDATLEEIHDTYGGGILDVVRDEDALGWLVIEDGSPAVQGEHRGRTPWGRTALPWAAIPDARDVKAALEAGARPPMEELVALHLTRAILPEPREGWAALLAAWTLGTYLLDRFRYYPILLLDGPAERGKTRCAKAVLWPSHRGMYTPSPSPATMFRDRARHRVAILLDIEDLPRLLGRGSDIGDLALNSFERDGVIRRCTRPDASPEEQVETFAAYGPTIICTNRSVRDSSPLASRCIRLAMPEAGAQVVPDAMRPDDALILRARCLAWSARLEADGVKLPEVDPPFTGRLRDLSLPLLRVLALVAPERVQDVLGVLQVADRERRAESATSWEARVAVALWELRDEVESGRLYVQTVTEHVNDGLSDSDQLTAQQVGTARRQLGLGSGKGGPHSRTFIKWPGDDTARALHDRYVPPSVSPWEESSEPSASSEPVAAVGEDGAEDPRKTRNTRGNGLPLDNPHQLYTSEDPEDPEDLRTGELEGGAPPASESWPGGPVEPESDDGREEWDHL